MTDLDESLARFQMCGFETGDQRPNIGPMAAQALVALGHAALLTGWVDLYAPRLPALLAGHVLSRDTWPAALGRPAQAANWLATFEAELAEKTWRALLNEQLPRLVEGLCDSTLQPLLRVAHAIRALDEIESAPRLRELAFGLAWWAAKHRETPACEAAVMTEVDPFLEGLIRRGVGVYLANPGARAANTLLVSAPSAVRTLIPHLESEARGQALGFLERALEVARKQSFTPARTGDADAEVEQLAKKTEELRYRAACSLQGHAIIFTDACLREAVFIEQHDLRRAAADAALRLSPKGYRDWSTET